MSLLANIEWDKILEVAGFTIGILYLWWEYHANPKLWIASVIMPAISMWIYFSRGLYADFAINIYYLIIAVYGYITWTHGSKKEDKEKLPITHIHKTILAGCVAIFMLLWSALYFILVWFTDSTVPLADAFTTALSIVAMWMLARKYIEQWIAWIAVDAVCVGLYAYKEIYLYAVLYAVYTVIACLGYRKWRRLM